MIAHYWHLKQLSSGWREGRGEWWKVGGREGGGDGEEGSVVGGRRVSCEGVWVGGEGRPLTNLFGSTSTEMFEPTAGGSWYVSWPGSNPCRASIQSTKYKQIAHTVTL